MFDGILAQAPTTLPAIAPREGSWFLPPQMSTGAPQVDTVFNFIYTVSAFFFILIVVLMIYFVWRYRRRVEGEKARSRVRSHTALELTWTGIPLILVVIMFYMGFRSFMDIVIPPEGAIDINVVGKKWNWFFTYPTGHVDGELHVPANTPIRLILESNDVIHSLYIPAFRLKKDAVPGRYNRAWFEATESGEYLLLCAEYCGTQHSDMLARVVVHDTVAEWENWLREASDPFQTRSMADVGQLLVQRWCSGCHSVDGSANIGPTLKDIYGREREFDDGTTLVAEENYIRESILYPQRRIVKGYGNNMSAFKGLLKDREITAIIAYMKELSGISSDVLSDEPDPNAAAEPTAPTADANAPAGEPNEP